MDRLLTDMAADPAMAQAVIDKVGEFAVEFNRQALQQIGPRLSAAAKRRSPKQGCVTSDPRTRSARLTERACRVPPHSAAWVLLPIVYRRIAISPVAVGYKMWWCLRDAPQYLGTVTRVAIGSLH